MNTLSFLGPIGTPEMILIFVVVLVLFGAKKIPEFAKGLGKATGEFKKAREDFQTELDSAEQSVMEESSKGKKEA